jgi:nucleoside 2-deoxyribosyltransferase
MKAVVYLAGPEVFLPNAHEIGAAKIACCRERGLDARFPLFSSPEGAETSAAARGHSIFEGCVRLMDECHLLIANMTPFRGVSMDAGTAVEMGYVFSRGRPVFGYTNVTGDYGSRVADDSLAVEDFGFADNLMCEGLVWKSGGHVVRRDKPDAERFSDLGGFRECVEQAIAVLSNHASAVIH